MNPKLSQVLILAPTKILIFLLRSSHPKYSSKISKGVKVTYSHTGKILKEFQSRGLIEMKLGHKQKPVKLTPKGFHIAILLNSIMDIE